MNTNGTIEVKERTGMTKRQLVWEAFKAQNPRWPFLDYLVRNDGCRALEKLSDEKLNEIINLKK